MSPELHHLLESAYERHHRLEFVQDDPISIPHRFDRPLDIEIAGFFTALISWGNRKSILRSASQLMDRMDGAPSDFVLEAGPDDLKRLDGFVHRTFFGEDAKALIAGLRAILEKDGSLEPSFTPAEGSLDVYAGISQFRQNMLSQAPLPQRTHKHLSNPERASAAKRLAMYLRWMCRSDSAGIDFGLWTNIGSSRLVVPLDVHTARTARELGLLGRKANDRKAVEELMIQLRRLDPLDPSRFDFALFGLSLEMAAKYKIAPAE